MPPHLHSRYFFGDFRVIRCALLLLLLMLIIMITAGMIFKNLFVDAGVILVFSSF